MRQVYLTDIIKEVPLIGGGVLRVIDIKQYCPDCLTAISFTRQIDNRDIVEVGDCRCSTPAQGTVAERTNYQVTRGGKDVTGELELRNGKANPFGWSQFEVWHNGQRIGFLESGSLDITNDYSPELGGYVVTEKKAELQ